MGRPRKTDAEKFCERCGTKMERRYFGDRLEDRSAFIRRKYCSLHCANQRNRPKHWETYHWRARRHRKTSCEACGLTDQLHARHVDGDPKNNEAQNIQTLCVYCHNFLHATAARRGWDEPGRMPWIGDGIGKVELLGLQRVFPEGWTDLEPSETP